MEDKKGFYWSMNCRDCYHCKQRAFRNEEELKAFSEEKEQNYLNGWSKKIKENGKVIISWCSKMKRSRLYANPPGFGKVRQPGAFCHHIDN